MKGKTICENCNKEFKWRRTNHCISPVRFCSRECKDKKHHNSYESLSDLFHLNSKKNGECIEWTGALAQNGYGKATYKLKTYSAHRLAYKFYNGDIEEGRVVRHLCHNKRCIRKEHLLDGTHKDNMRDMTNANRQAKGDRNFAHLHPEKMKRGSGVGTSKLNEEQVREIKKMLTEGDGYQKISLLYKVHPATIQRIKLNKNWKHVGVE